MERRIVDGDAYTWEAFSAYYKKKHTKKEIAAYWKTCKVVVEESLAQPAAEFVLAQNADNGDSASTCTPARTRGSRGGKNTVRKQDKEAAEIADAEAHLRVGADLDGHVEGLAKMQEMLNDLHAKQTAVDERMEYLEKPLGDPTN